MAAVLYKVDPVMIKLSIKMIFVISAACLLGSIHARSSGAAVTTAAARGEVSLVKVGDETYEDILDINGEQVRYGDNFTLWLPDLGFGIIRRYFGLGGEGVVVETDIETTLNFDTDTYICQDDGILGSVPLSEGATPSQKSLVRVRRNADDTYHLQITEETPAVFVQFQDPSVSPHLCQRGVEGSRIRFQLTSSSSTSSSTIVPHGGRPAQRASEHHAIATPIIPFIQLPTSA